MVNIDQFNTISYLATGNAAQKEVYALLANHKLLAILSAYQPLLVGTVPIDIAIEGSDLDIICCFEDIDTFEQHLRSAFKHHHHFNLKTFVIDEQQTMVANFIIDNWPIEIFGQQIPTKQQNGYRHMIAEYLLIEQHGEAFKQQIIALKKQGLKTEPAFAKALNLPGNPYVELLKFGL